MNVFTILLFVKRFMWYHTVFTQYIYYRDFFFSDSALRLCNCQCHGWVRYINTTKIMVWCVSSLIFSIDIRWFWFLIMFYFKLSNNAMLEWWILGWCNGEIKIMIVCFVSRKYWIFSFSLFSNTKVLQQTKQSLTLNFWSLTTSTATKFMLPIQATTDIQGFIRGRKIVVRDIVTLI